MKILFDNRWSGNHGIGRFSKEIISRMNNVDLIPSIGHPSSPYDSFYLAWQIFKGKPDVFFSPGYNPPIAGKTPFVFTLCDLNHIKTQENSTLLKRAYYERIIKPACHRAKKVITISEFSKNEIIQWSGIKEEKVINVGLGVSPHFSPTGDQMKLDLPFLLYVGNNKPHKNLERLIKAFELSTKPKEALLVLSGSPTSKLNKILSTSTHKKNIEFIGNISEDDLPKFYRGAKGLVFPSVYEGFGLPVLEAMACGTPVLTSNTSALREIASKASILVNPYSIDEISQGINQLLNNNGQLKNNVQAGLEKAKSYTWKNTANKVQAALEAA